MTSIKEIVHSIQDQDRKERVEAFNSSRRIEDIKNQQLENEMIESRKLMKRSSVVEALAELNGDLLEGKGNLVQKTTILKKEVTYEDASGSLDDRGTHTRTVRYGATLAELRWAKNRKEHFSILIGVGENHIKVEAGVVDKNYPYLNDPKRETFINCEGGINVNPELNDYEIKEIVKNNIAEHYVYILKYLA